MGLLLFELYIIKNSKLIRICKGLAGFEILSVYIGTAWNDVLLVTQVH